jgi:hypothetical protein
LEQLVDQEDLDGLLDLVSPREIAEAWFRYTAGKGWELRDHPDWWAVDLFFTTEIFRRSDLYRTLLLRLLEHPDPDMDWNVAAGPLENFLSDDPDDLAWLELECATNPRLRRALTGTAAASYVTPDTLWRLDAAAGEPLPRPFRGPVDAAHAERIQAARADLEAVGDLSLLSGEPETTPEQAAAIAVLLAAMHAHPDPPLRP